MAYVFIRSVRNKANLAFRKRSRTEDVAQNKPDQFWWEKLRSGQLPPRVGDRKHSSRSDKPGEVMSVRLAQFLRGGRILYASYVALIRVAGFVNKVLPCMFQTCCPRRTSLWNHSRNNKLGTLLKHDSRGRARDSRK